VDLNLACAAYLTEVQGEKVNAYELSACYFPDTIAGLLQHGKSALRMLQEVVSFTRKNGTRELHGPAGEKVTYRPTEIRLLPPFQKPEKRLCIGFSHKDA